MMNQMWKWLLPILGYISQHFPAGAEEKYENLIG
jgi:hypothetical protein